MGFKKVFVSLIKDALKPLVNETERPQNQVPQLPDFIPPEDRTFLSSIKFLLEDQNDPDIKQPDDLPKKKKPTTSQHRSQKAPKLTKLIQETTHHVKVKMPDGKYKVFTENPTVNVEELKDNEAVSLDSDINSGSQTLTDDEDDAEGTKKKILPKRSIQVISSDSESEEELQHKKRKRVEPVTKSDKGNKSRLSSSRKHKQKTEKTEKKTAKPSGSVQKKKKKKKKDSSDDDRPWSKHLERTERAPFVWDTEEGFGDDDEDDDDYTEEDRTAGKKRKLNREASSAAKNKPQEPTAGLHQLVDNQAGLSHGEHTEHGGQINKDDDVQERILMDVGFEPVENEDIGDNIQVVQAEVHKENKTSEDSEIEFLEVTTASSETMEKFKQREKDEKERQKKEIYNEIKKCPNCEPTLCCMKHIFQITAISIKKDVDGDPGKSVDVKKEKEEDDKRKKKDEQEAQDKSIDQRPKGDDEPPPPPPPAPPSAGLAPNMSSAKGNGKTGSETKTEEKQSPKEDTNGKKDKCDDAESVALASDLLPDYVVEDLLSEFSFNFRCR